MKKTNIPSKNQNYIEKNEIIRIKPMKIIENRNGFEKILTLFQFVKLLLFKCMKPNLFFFEIPLNHIFLLLENYN